MANNFINKILQAEVTPPDSSWEKISAELKRTVTQNFVSKLNDASVDPPAHIWNQVAAALSASQRKISTLPVVNRWVAAAAILAVVAVTAGYFLSRDRTVQTAISPQPQRRAVPGTITDTVANSSATAHSNNVSRVNETKERTTTRRNANGSATRPKYASVEVPPMQLAKRANDPKDGLSANLSNASGTFISPPTYFVVTAPNGQRVKISSKFSEAASYLFANGEADDSWKQRFEKWKSKLMTNPGFMPTAGNFLDIAELKDLLKEQ